MTGALRRIAPLLDVRSDELQIRQGYFDLLVDVPVTSTGRAQSLWLNQTGAAAYDLLHPIARDRARTPAGCRSGSTWSGVPRCSTLAAARRTSLSGWPARSANAVW
nr:hypothetical protein [Fodinicola feengrottensis]